MQILKELFKTKNQVVNFISEELINKRELSTQDIIKEIHYSFDTEVDKLLKFSSELNNLDSKNEELLQKRERLVNLGFENSKEVKEANLELQRLNLLKQENLVKNNINEAILYYSTKYPLYRFITEDSVKELCKKYNLVYGTVDKYIGDIPDENLKEIENFKLKDEDEVYVKIKDIINPKIYSDYSLPMYITQIKYYHNPKDLTIPKAKLEIVAPLKDFNLTKSEIKDFKVSNIVIPDPIVLKPVVYKNTKHYLIITKWGLEASDSLVTNSKYN